MTLGKRAHRLPNFGFNAIANGRLDEVSMAYSTCS
jgi:hypothetical protein